MYESFYKLHTTPFRLTPDPRFFFASETHKRGLAYLRYAFYQREGFVVITGAPGTGKTELMLNLIGELPQRKVTLAKIVTSNLDADDLLDLVASSFSIDPEHLSKGALLKRLEDYFVREYRMGKQVLLLIDEAHNLSVKSLIELSMLSNFQIDARPVMQCFLLGQRPLERKFRLPKLAPLKQRVIASTRLENLDVQETCDYITHRLAKSGWDNDPAIDNDVFPLIHYYSQGTPRRINSLCSRLLLQAYLDHRHHIGADNVRQVISEIQEETVGNYPGGDETELPVKDQSADQSPVPPANDSPPLQTLRNDVDRPISLKNVIDTPPFTAHQGNHYATSALTILDEESSNAVRDLPQWLDTSPVVDDTPPIPIYDPQIDEAEAVDRTAIDSLIRETPSWDVGLPPATYRDVKQQSRSPTTQPARDIQKNSAVQSRNRSSGLLDKELKYLSSLQESSSNGNDYGAPQPPARQETVPKSSGPSKVIIDDSIYDVYGVRKPDREEEHPRRDNVAEPEKYFWRKMFIAIFALAIIAVPMRSWYHRHSDAANRVTAPVSQPPVAVNPVTKNAGTAQGLAESASAAGSEATQNTANSSDEASAPASKPEPALANGPTAIPGTIKPPVQASAIEPSSRDTHVKPSSAATAPADNATASHFAAFENRTDSAQQTPQSAQPVNHLNDNAQPAGAANTNKVKKSTTTGDNDRNASPQQSPATVEQKSAATQVTMVPVRPYSMNQHWAIQPETAAKPVAKNSSASDASSNVNARSTSSNAAPLAGAPLTQHEASTATSSVATLDTQDTATTHPESNARKDTQQSEPDISLADLTTLVARLSYAYESGNLQQLTSIFADDMQNVDGADRDQLHDEYRQLFDITDKRRLIINNVAWSARNQQMLGKGDFQLIIREKGATKPTLYAGQIRLAVAREPRGVVIKKLDYDYNQ